MYDTGGIYQSVLPYKDTTHFATTTYTYAATPYAGAFPTTIANALSQNTIKTYDLNTGLVTSVEDPNLLPTTYTYDNMARLIQTSEPDGGQTTNCYTDEGGTGCSQSGPPFQLVTTKKINATQNEIATTVFDRPRAQAPGIHEIGPIKGYRHFRAIRLPYSRRQLTTKPQRLKRLYHHEMRVIVLLRHRAAAPYRSNGGNGEIR
jgi:hypothetical protein